MTVVFERPHALSDVSMHYCPGCTHGIIHRLVAEVIDEMDIEGTTIAVVPVGCSVMAYNYFECDVQEAAHAEVDVEVGHDSYPSGAPPGNDPRPVR